MTHTKKALVAIILSLSIGPALASDSDQAQNIKAWREVNGQFRSIYSARRESIKNNLDPIVMVKGNDLILVRKGKKEKRFLISDRYDFFKIVSHIPLAIYVCLYQEGNESDTTDSVSQEKMKDLRALKTSVKTASANMAVWELPEKVETRQSRIIDRSLKLIDQVLESKKISRTELRNYCRAMAPAVLDNAYDAVKIELGNVDQGMKGFKETISKEEWDNLYVVIMSGHMPRLKERRVQYFSKLFKEANPGHRVIYYEGPPFEDDSALELVATHILDRHVAVDFFKDPARMHRDLLSDAAKKYLSRNNLKWSRK